MEKYLDKNFEELTMSEMQGVDGGEWAWYDYVLAGLIPGYSVYKYVEEDLSNCYSNAYNEVMTSAGVSSGDAR